MLFEDVAVLWCYKENLKIVAKLSVFHWLKFAVLSQAQDSNSHIFVSKKYWQVEVVEGL